jgi:hypothetical protein
MSTAKNVEIIPVGDPRRPDWIPAKNAQGWPLNVYIDEGCWREERWGQYVLPAYDPTKPGGHTGRGQTWQRATTFIGMAEYHGDGLADYRIRHALAGLIRRPDLLVRAARLWELPDKHFMEKEQQDALKEEWREIAAEAHEASGGDEASRNGTEVHAAIEHVNRGGTVDTLPTSIKIDGVEADLTVRPRHHDAYLDLRDGDNGFEVFPELVERVVNPDEDGTSGKFDLLALYQAPDSLIDNMNVQRVKDGLEPLEYWTAPRFVVVDIKSGDTQYREKFSRQLYRYARADAYWIFEEDAYEDAPDDVCQDFGFVISVPWWEADPKVEMIPIPYGKVAINGTHACRQVKNARSLRLPTMKPVGLGYAPREIEAPEKKGGFKARNKRVKSTVERVDRIAVTEGRNDDDAEDEARDDEHDDVADETWPEEYGPGAQPDETARNGHTHAAELAPLAGPGERGCGVCGRKGHRRGSPKCLGDNDPSKVKAAERSESFRRENEGPELAGDKPEQWCRRTGACAGAGWTGPVQEGDAWVCGDCGLPSRAGQISGTGRPADPMATLTPIQKLRADLADEPETHPVGGHKWTLDRESQTWTCAVGGESAKPEQVPAIEQDERDAEDARVEAEAEALLSDVMDRVDNDSSTTGDTAILSGDEAEIRKWWTPNSDPDDDTTEADLTAALRVGEMVRAGSAKPGEVHDVVMLPGADGPEQYDRNSDHPRKHEFEAGPGSSGRVCTRMVMLDDGSGDECGATPAEHGPTLAEAAEEPEAEESISDNEMTDEEYWLQLLVAAQSRSNVIRVGQESQKALGALTPALKEAGKAGLKKYPKDA